MKRWFSTIYRDGVFGGVIKHIGKNLKKMWWEREETVLVFYYFYNSRQSRSWNHCLGDAFTSCDLNWHKTRRASPKTPCIHHKHNGVISPPAAYGPSRLAVYGPSEWDSGNCVTVLQHPLPEVFCRLHTFFSPHYGGCNTKQRENIMAIVTQSPTPKWNP